MTKRERQQAKRIAALEKQVDSLAEALRQALTRPAPHPYPQPVPYTPQQPSPLMPMWQPSPLFPSHTICEC